jgi:Zn-dependent M32 family carboxypeptidase
MHWKLEIDGNLSDWFDNRDMRNKKAKELEVSWKDFDSIPSLLLEELDKLEAGGKIAWRKNSIAWDVALALWWWWVILELVDYWVERFTKWMSKKVDSILNTSEITGFLDILSNLYDDNRFLASWWLIAVALVFKKIAQELEKWKISLSFEEKQKLKLHLDRYTVISCAVIWTASLWIIELLRTAYL